MPSIAATRGWPLLLALGLAACQGGWVRLDGNRAETAALRAAEKACRVDERLAEADAERSRRLRESDSNAATMLARDDYDLRLRAIRDELEECMRERGFRPG